MTNNTMLTIGIKNIGSSAIRELLRNERSDQANWIGVYEHPFHVGSSDWEVNLWELPSGDLVFETNGNIVSRKFALDDFIEICNEYGVEAEVVL